MKIVPIQLIIYVEIALLDVFHVKILHIASNVIIKKFCLLIKKRVVLNVTLIII